MFAALLVLLPHGALHAAGLGKITGISGATPATVMVEQPQDALKYWQPQGLKGATLLIISEDLPLFPLDTDETGSALKSMANGRWDKILARPYQTPVYYPVNRASFVYLAARAGMVSRIYWVPPANQSLGEDSLGRVKANFRALGATQAELDEASYSEKMISGKVAGLPVFVCGLGDLPAIDGEVMLDVDLSFFATLYKNEVNTPMLDMVAKFMHALSASGVRVSGAVLSYSTSTGVVPLEQRFIGRYLYRFLTDPDSLSKGPPQTWLLRSEAMYNETFFQTEEALKLYKEAVDADPADASLRFDLARSYYSAKDIDRMKEALDAAVALDMGYYPAYVSYGRYLLIKGVTEAAEDFASEAVRACPDNPEVWKFMHEAKDAAKKYSEAADAQKRYISMGYDGPQPLYELAGDYYLMKDYDSAMDGYRKALGMLPILDSSGLRPKVLIGMAEVYETKGNIREALDAYSDAFDSTVDKKLKKDIALRYKKLSDKWKPFMGGGG